MNPFAFRPAQVTVWTTLIYLALLIPLIVINETVPSPPGSHSQPAGLNLTEAWLDLATVSSGYHPFNSHKNDEIRNWLLLRIQSILDENGVSWKTDESGKPPPSNYSARTLTLSSVDDSTTADIDAVVFNDLSSNITADYAGAFSAYFEGTNIIVYIRGSEDEDGEWWKKPASDRQGPIGKGGVLVNAHYDSVATGFGATDDGMGVVTVLQLIKYFTTPGHKPKKGILALLNNGEEDGLYGARAFGNSPVMPFAHTFLNLEGAGAGYRPLLFRTSDQEVTKAFSGAKDPFGTVICSDAFGVGFIRSQTDYVVFNGMFGARGLDLSFFRPRAQYHTNQDDRRYTKKGSLWNMISASVSTVINLSSDTSKTFVGERRDGDRSKVQNGRGSDGVWFDLFAKAFVVFNLRGLFAWSLTILITTPLILVLVTYILQRKDKYYFFTTKSKSAEAADTASAASTRISIGGLKGLFRFPLALVFSGALVIGAALLVAKVNPLIIHSSEYSVWAMMISLFYFSFWCIMKGADFTRPSALHRGYAYIWLFIIGWLALIGVTVLEDRFKIASGYALVFFETEVFLAALITLLELFALPNKASYASQAEEDDEIRDHLQEVPNEDALIAPSPGEVDPALAPADEEDEEAEPASETTPLVGGRVNGGNERTTFATTYRRSIAALANVSRKSPAQDDKKEPYGEEQPWSGTLPTWTWFLQFLLFGPFLIILFGQIGLLLTSAMHQSAEDGSAVQMPYLLIAFITIFLLIPLTPHIHRVTHHIPLFLLCVFVGTLIYNLVAFPFSASNRYKVFWQQTVNLDTGASAVKLAGFEEYIRPIIAELPSAAGKSVSCSPTTGRYANLRDCVYDGSGILPNVTGGDLPPGVPLSEGLADLVSVETSSLAPGKALIEVNGKNTKACIVNLKTPVANFLVEGGLPLDERFGPLPAEGIKQIKLWRRDWKKPWKVTLEWDPEAVAVDAGGAGDAEGADAGLGRTDELKARMLGLEGNVSCVWSDANVPGTIPALDEALKYPPPWVAITKHAEGLVEGSKSFLI
ncbi:Peptide hydrolase [Pleurostoma richardsiae]|uniref:Peptide hydrolase n=1 Tax=Pleurostoma richardsiae TaxID=41990 RepID=A0AA38RUC6_9PEZI|nr:Peptide hydrolase [Pleurostoma richardsiae]